MSLYLSEIKIKGHELKVSATLPLPADDISGESSYSETVETGDKSKQLSISLHILFKNDADLTRIITLAEAKTDNNDRVVYNIDNATAKAMNIRQARFQGDISVREDASLELWAVTFKLSEVRSVPEKKETRVEAQPVADQSATGQTVEQETTPEQVADLSTMEKVLKWVEDSVAPSEA